MRRAPAFLCLLLATSAASAADTPPVSCQTFERAPACCPHPPPSCCPASLAAPLDDALVGEVCGGAAPKGQNAAFNACKRYYQRGADVGEVVLGREPGDRSTFDKIRTQMSSGGGQASAIKLAGADAAFVLRELDEAGRVQRSSAWALSRGEIVHVEAERAACDDTQVVRLLERALQRRDAGAPARRATL
jgi:hypothetical protein